MRKPIIDLEKAFKFKGSFEHNGKQFRIDVDSLQDLVLVSGKIAVGDPFNIEDFRIHKRVQPGSYSVERACRCEISERYGEVACMRVLLSRSRPVRWISAIPSMKFGGAIAGRANCCCIADAHAVRQLCEPAAYDESPIFNVWDSEGPSILDKQTGCNLVCSGFLGYDRGPDAAFWGVDSKGRICRLVFDFGHLSETVLATKTIATVEELIGNTVVLKTRVGVFEVTARTVPRKKEVHIKVTGGGCTHLEWDVQQSDRDPQLRDSGTAMSGDEVLERRFLRLKKTGPLEYPVTVTYPTRTRPLL